MASHHDAHTPQEKKPVAFIVPLILGAVTVLVMLLFLSMCDPSQDHGHGDHAAPHGTSGHGQPADGHRHATDAENVQSHGSSQGPDAQPSREGTGSAGH